MYIKGSRIQLAPSSTLCGGHGLITLTTSACVRDTRVQHSPREDGKVSGASCLLKALEIHFIYLFNLEKIYVFILRERVPRRIRGRGTSRFGL